MTAFFRSAGRYNSQKVSICFPLLMFFFLTCPTKAWTETPSFSEWHDVLERAFTDFQRQEDKLLDVDSAGSLTWEKGLRSAVRPENSVIEAERENDPKAVEALEGCRNALMVGGVLRLKALGRLPPGRNNPLNIDGDIPFDQYAHLYISFAETCEEGLHLPHPANAFRTRYR